MNIARIKKNKASFEIVVDPELVQEYLNGKVEDVLTVLTAEGIYSEAKKGLVASEQDLKAAFGTSDAHSIVEQIIKNGEVQQTSKQRDAERNQKFKQIITIIHQNAVDPHSGHPHPQDRIEAAMDEAGITLDEHKDVNEQVSDIVKKLQPILPIRFEIREYEITIPAEYAGKSYSAVKESAKIISDSWNNDGSWTAVVKIAAGLSEDFFSKLNELTKGEVDSKRRNDRS